MQGLSFASLKKHPSLIPLYVCMGAGAVLASYYIIRLATRNPDVSWGKDKIHSNEYYKTKQYKFVNTHIDWDTYKSPAPEYKTEEK